MKDRIIQYLHDFSEGKSEDLATEIRTSFEADSHPFTPTSFKLRSQEVLALILHQYGQFSISTIDAFFQRIIRSFTRETGLLGNFRLETENTLILAEVVDKVMMSLSEKKELRNWVLEFSMDRLLDGKDWDVRKEMVAFASQIFSEEFKRIEEEILTKTQEPNFFSSLRKKLVAELKEVELEKIERATALLTEFHQHELTEDNFKGKSKGSVYAYVVAWTKPDEWKELSPKAKNYLDDASEWGGGSAASKKMVQHMAEQKWQAQFVALVDLLEQNRERYYSAKQVLNNFYAFGLLADISRTLKIHLAENNLMLLSDAPVFLRGIIRDQDASFVYEKVGSFYRHYLIDEFQDTSGFQWLNLAPLVENGIAQQYKSLIVGDIKQSIYRWRGGDLTILQETVTYNIPKEVVETNYLDKNFRSAGNIVSFNNAIFTTASALIGQQTASDFPVKAYDGTTQHPQRHLSKGYVEVNFLEGKTTSFSADGEEENLQFKEASLSRLPIFLETLQVKGVALSDIVFLVRDKADGERIVNYLLHYKNSDQAKPGARYDVVSNESLRIDQSTAISIVINAMRFLDDPDNRIARAHLAYVYQQLWPSMAFTNHHQTFSKSKTKELEKLLPESFFRFQHTLSALPVVELGEQLISIFRLANFTNQLIYLQAFQDVLLDFAHRERNDLTSFLQWWDENSHRKFVQVSGGVDAARIITIHKSKGLEFKYVIIPFLAWELNHKSSKQPILWCKAESGSLSEAGYLPVKYSSALGNTVFKNDFNEERKRIFLDNLNLLYVAFTRAEMGLMVNALASTKKTDSPLQHVGQLVQQVMETDTSLRQYYSLENNQFSIGTIEKLAEDKRQLNMDSLKRYPINIWRDRLQVRTIGKEFFQVSKQREKINFGVFLHALMARIRTKADAANVLHESLQEGLIRQDELEPVTEMVQWIINHEKLQDSFQHDVLVKMEASLLLPKGTEKRIDRLSVRNNEVILIDYKTGEPVAKDQEQVREYLSLLRSMNQYEKVVGYLVYVHTQMCIELV